MSDQRVIGRCSECGGRVLQYKSLMIVGPFPPAVCESCGAKEAPTGPTIKMIPKDPLNPRLSDFILG